MSCFKNIPVSCNTGSDVDLISPGISIICIYDVCIVLCIGEGAVFLVVFAAYQQIEFNSVCSVSGIDGVYPLLYDGHLSVYQCHGLYFIEPDRSLCISYSNVSAGNCSAVICSIGTGFIGLQ